jgi:RHS repeat-associated protein
VVDESKGCILFAICGILGYGDWLSITLGTLTEITSGQVFAWRARTGHWGEGHSILTGERWEAYAELLFLRARYYQPGTGRFASKDPWEGSLWRPQAHNGWGYVEGDPVNVIDPTGLDGIKIWEEIPAGTAVGLAEVVYGKAGLLRVCLLNPDDGQRSSDTVNDLLTDYVCEYGPAHRYFGANDHLTEQLAKSFPLCKLRQNYYLRNNDVMGGAHVFGNMEFLQATVDSILRGDPAWYIIPWRNLDVTHFMGSFQYTISRHGFDKVRFEIRNETDLASGTRIPPILGGAPVEDASEAFSVEEILEWYPEISSWTLGQIMEQYPIISILSPKTREQTGGFLDLEGGGTMKQTFIWFEPYSMLGCWSAFVPCPALDPFWRIEGPPDSETSL